MLTQAQNEALSEADRLTLLKAAKGGTWYSDHWQPYCLNCSTMERMARQPYGFKCRHCHSRCGWDLECLFEDRASYPKPYLYHEAR